MREEQLFGTFFGENNKPISVINKIISYFYGYDVYFNGIDLYISDTIENGENMIDGDKIDKTRSIENYPSLDLQLSRLIQRLEKQYVISNENLNSIRDIIQSNDYEKIIYALLLLLRDERLNTRFRSDCLLALTRVLESCGNEKAVKILLSLVKDNKLSEKMRYRCFELLNEFLVNYGYKKTVNVLRSLVRDEKLPMEIRHDCVEALTRVLSSRGDGEAVEVLLSLVRDEQLAMMLRLACVQTLGHLAKGVALAMLADVSLPGEMRAALVLALGQSGDCNLSAPLRVCWEREQDERLRRILLLALVCLDDPSVLVQVEELALQDHPGEFLSPSESDLWAARLPEYLAKHSSAETLGRLLRRGKLLRGKLSRLSIIEAIEAAERRDLVPVLLDVLEHSSLRAERMSLRGAKLQSLIGALSQLGETPEVARRLLALFQRAVTDANLPVGYWVVDYLFEALWHVTRRAGLLVVERPRGSQRYVLLPRRG